MSYTNFQACLNQKRKMGYKTIHKIFCNHLDVLLEDMLDMFFWWEFQINTGLTCWFSCEERNCWITPTNCLLQKSGKTNLKTLFLLYHQCFLFPITCFCCDEAITTYRTAFTWEQVTLLGISAKVKNGRVLHFSPMKKGSSESTWDGQTDTHTLSPCKEELNTITHPGNNSHKKM